MERGDLSTAPLSKGQDEQGELEEAGQGEREKKTGEGRGTVNRGVEAQRGKEKDRGKVSGDERRKDILEEMCGGKETERHPVTKKGGRVSEAQSPGACRRLGGTEVCPGCDSRSEAGEKEAACWVGDSEPMEERVSGSGQESNK